MEYFLIKIFFNENWLNCKLFLLYFSLMKWRPGGRQWLPARFDLVGNPGLNYIFFHSKWDYGHSKQDNEHSKHDFSSRRFLIQKITLILYNLYQKVRNVEKNKNNHSSIQNK